MTLLAVQKMLGDRLGKDIFFYSITVDPEHDTPVLLKEFADRHGAGPGWTFYTGKPDDIDMLRKRLGFRDIDPVADQDKSRHITLLRYGNEKLDRWAACPAMTNPEEVVKFLSWLEPIKEPQPGVFVNSRPDDFRAPGV
jgi:protein SCO1/2